MNNHTEMPVIGWADDGPTYDTLHTVMQDWCARVWLTDGYILVARWDGEAVTPSGEDGTRLIVWDNTAGDYVSPVIIPTDNIRKIEIL